MAYFSGNGVTIRGNLCARVRNAATDAGTNELKDGHNQLHQSWLIDLKDGDLHPHSAYHPPDEPFSWPMLTCANAVMAVRKEAFSLGRAVVLLPQLGYHRSMWGSASHVHSVEQRIALLKQQERELRTLFTHSHAIRNDTEEIATKLVVLAGEIAELESAIPSKSP